MLLHFNWQLETLFCLKVLFFTGAHSQCLDVGGQV